MNDSFGVILCFSVNLTFIVTNLYGWLLKRFFVPEAYKENLEELYPAQRSVAGFFEDHLTMSDLLKQMNTNKTYLSEVIASSEYGSFYQLINTLRIDHACWMLSEDPTLKMEQVALSSGFSSGSAFSQVFKRIKGVSPSEYLHR